jgi:hypothetical protein
MAFWKNKHVALASVMAPILGLVSYFGIGAIFGEKPHPAAAGQSYQLIEKPNCRYDSGQCGLKNVDFELTLSFERLDDGRMLLKLESVIPLDGVKLALVDNAAEEVKPVDMQATGSDGLHWVLEIRHPNPEHDRLRLVASSMQTLYFGDVATKFTASESTSETSK